MIGVKGAAPVHQMLQGLPTNSGEGGRRGGASDKKKVFFAPKTFKGSILYHIVIWLSVLYKNGTLYGTLHQGFHRVPLHHEEDAECR